MEVMTHPYLKATTEEIKKIRQFYGLGDINKIEESVDAIEEWLKKEDHLAEASKYIDRDVIERIFVLSRGSVEGAKAKFDKCLTIRGLTPELCLGKSIEEVEKISETLIYIPLPKLNPTDFSRVMIAQSISTGWNDFNLVTLIRCMFLTGEYRIFVDYCLAERYVIDFKGVSINILTKMNPIILKKAEILATEGYGVKIKGIHILNAPTFIDKIVNVLKQVLKPKIAGRVHVHSTYEDLHQHISKEILPMDYGGDAPSCQKLHEQWQNVLNSEEGRKVIKYSEKHVSDESKRCEMKFNQEYLGMPGSFRKLATD